MDRVKMIARAATLGLCLASSGAGLAMPQAAPSPMTALGRLTITCGADGAPVYSLGGKQIGTGGADGACTDMPPMLAMSRKFPSGEQVLGVIEPVSATFSEATLIRVAPGKPPAIIRIDYLSDLGAMPAPNKISIAVMGVIGRPAMQRSWTCLLTLDWARGKVVSSVWTGGARGGSCST